MPQIRANNDFIVLPFRLLLFPLHLQRRLNCPSSYPQWGDQMDRQVLIYRMPSEGWFGIESDKSEPAESRKRRTRRRESYSESLREQAARQTKDVRGPAIFQLWRDKHRSEVRVVGRFSSNATMPGMPPRATLIDRKTDGPFRIERGTPALISTLGRSGVTVCRTLLRF